MNNGHRNGQAIDFGLSSDFCPFPFLRNPHLQTLLGHWWKGKFAPLAYRACQVALADGDRLLLYDSVPSAWQPGKPMALVVHGLGGSHLSGPVQRLAGLLLPHGIRVVRIDLRGSGGGASLARKIYNGGCSGDIRMALAEMHCWDPTAPLILAGFSLGGNIALKLAGEAAELPVPGLKFVAAVAPPIDLERCAGLLSEKRNRFYEFHFVRALVKQVRAQERNFPDLPPASFPRRLTMRQFDDIYTAPRGGFTGADDYYRRSGALPLVPHITIPTYVVTARDDPFVAVEPFEALHQHSHMTVHISAHGGHLGFLGRDGAGGVRWAERRLADWIVQR